MSKRKYLTTEGKNLDNVFVKLEDTVKLIPKSTPRYSRSPN